MFASRAPQSELQGLVELIWFASGPTTTAVREWVLPFGRGQMLVNFASDRFHWHRSPADSEALGDIALVGPFSQPLLVETSEQERVCGILFTATGLAGLVGSVAAITNQMVSLGELDLDVTRQDHLRRAKELAGNQSEPAAILDILEQGLVRALLPFRSETKERSVRTAVALLTNGGCRIRSVAEHVGRPQRALSLEFRELVGLSPKRYQRLQRFRRVLAALSETQDFVETALALGFVDQAHFNHDFREFAAMTPSEYLARRTGYLGHVRAL